jgi:hypothetical protein
MARAPHDLALSAFEAAVMGDDPRAASAVRELAADRSGAALVRAMCRWADTLTEFQGGPRPGGVPPRPLWADPVSGGVIADPGQVDAVSRWAGRFLEARARQDHSACEALFRDLPPGRAEQYAAAVLHTAAGMIRIFGVDAGRDEEPEL